MSLFEKLMIIAGLWVIAVVGIFIYHQFRETEEKKKLNSKALRSKGQNETNVSNENPETKFAPERGQQKYIGRNAPSLVWHPSIPRPKGAWKIFARTSVAGTRYHFDEVESFLTQAQDTDPSKIGLDLQPDPGNPHDANAIRIYGYVDGARFHLGYVPAELASELSATAPPDMPISAHLQRVYRGDYAADITFHILVPAQRSDFWMGRKNPFAGPAGAKAVWTGPRSIGKNGENDDTE